MHFPKRLAQELRDLHPGDRVDDRTNPGGCDALSSPIFSQAFATSALRRGGDGMGTPNELPDAIEAIADMFNDDDILEAIEMEKASNRRFASWLADRPSFDWNEAAARNFAPDTFGAELYRCPRAASGLSRYASSRSAAGDLDFIRTQTVSNHELLGLLMGYRAQPAGEQALALMEITSNALSFSPPFARLLNMLPAFSSAARYARSCFSFPELMPAVLEAMQHGIRAGTMADQPLLMVDWHAYLSWSVDDIKADLGLRLLPCFHGRHN